VTSAEALLIDLGGSDPLITELIAETGPLLVPFDTLTDVDGWVVDLNGTNSNVPFDAPDLESERRAVNALLVATDYAIRRGATNVADVIRVLNRESPVSVSGTELLSDIVRSVVVRAGIDGRTPAAFKRRRRGHQLTAGSPSDPAISFKPRSMDKDIGDNSHSSLLILAEGASDDLGVEGEIGERWGVEIGLPAEVTLDTIAEIEREVAIMPSYIRGLTSYADVDGIVLGWPDGQEPDPHTVAVVIQGWTKALFDLHAADVRIVFAPATGESAVLTDMRARATAARLYRDAMRRQGSTATEPE
jgi:hypothetical protein